MEKWDFDYVIIGSGFGGSVSALRLAEKGYKVKVLEKGRWFKSEDFPKTNWNLKQWMWVPALRFWGFFKITYLNHVTVLSGVGVGGGSLTYANTLPVPESAFFQSGSWAGLQSWQKVLTPFYDLAYKMLGAETNPKLSDADELLQELAVEMGKKKDFAATKVAVHFGQPGQTVSDPYFGGRGPSRTGCIHCGACMTGCRHNAKNTLDKNYLYLAQQAGVEIQAQSEAYDVFPICAKDGSDGYRISWKGSAGNRRKGHITSRGVIFAGGVMGTVPLLLKLRERSLPLLSPTVGHHIRTNNESLMVITSTLSNNRDYSKGIAIGSILHTDANSHLEPVRYGAGSGFFRLLTVPAIYNRFFVIRLLGMITLFFKNPLRLLRTVFSKAYAQRSVILLFMQTLDSTLRMKRGIITKVKTEKEGGTAPTAFIPEAFDIGNKLGDKLQGVPYANITDMIFGSPTTAHILGGCVMGEDSSHGVIDHSCHVYGYRNMMVCDGSMISANPGVNPSLTITAISEYAMSHIPPSDHHS